MGSVGKVTGTAFDYNKFSDRLDLYIGGGYQVAGPAGVFQKEDIEYIKKNMQETSRSMFRVEDNDWTAKDLKVGDTINFNNEFKSFTKSSIGVNNILRDAEENDLYDSPVIFRTTGSQKFFDVQAEGRKIGNSAYDYQEEAFLKGHNWKIKKINYDKRNGKKVKIVTIE